MKKKMKEDLLLDLEAKIDIMGDMMCDLNDQLQNLNEKIDAMASRGVLSRTAPPKLDTIKEPGFGFRWRERG